MRTIVATAGTSIAGGVPMPGLGPAASAEDEARFRQGIDHRLQELHEGCRDTESFLKRASAETNSLRALRDAGRFERGNSVLLLHTETTGGRICTKAVAQLLADSDFDGNVSVQQIDGLQVHDAQQFRRAGIQNLFAELDRRCGPALDDPNHEVLLNATGGFKAVVPYVTLYGLLNRLPVVYLFERSDTLLWLPPAPVNFDYERLAQAQDALLQLQREDVMEREAFLKAIPGTSYHDRDRYEALLEEEGGLVTLSAFGRLLVDRLGREEAPVYLSRNASDSYRKSCGSVREQFTFMLERVKSPLWRREKVHSFAGTDLTVYKPGNTGERMACILRGANVYVCELLPHDEYKRILSQRCRADYDLSQFTPWVLPTGEEVPSTEEDAYRRLQQRFERLEQVRETSKVGWQRQRQEFQQQCDLQSQALEGSRRQAVQLQSRLEQAEQDIQAARGELEAEQVRGRELSACVEAEREQLESERLQSRELAAELQASRQAREEEAATSTRLAFELDACRRQLELATRPWWKKLLQSK